MSFAYFKYRRYSCRQTLQVVRIYGIYARIESACKPSYQDYFVQKLLKKEKIDLVDLSERRAVR